MKFVIISVVVISVIGTLSHFLYDISKHNKVIGIFTAVNESVWEHIKIALTPTFLWGLVDGYVYGLNPNYFLAKFLSVLSIIILMPLLFYSYRIFLKKEILVVDIISFYIEIIVSQLIFHYIVELEPLNFIYNYIGCALLFILFGGYMIHTLMPAKSFLFKDPISNKYGFRGHTHEEEKH